MAAKVAVGVEPPHCPPRVRDNARMQLSTIASPGSPPAHDPRQPALPGLDSDVVARWGRPGDRTAPVSVRRDQPVDAPTYAAFEDAVRAANEVMVADRREARWGLFGRNPGRVDAIALLEAADGIRLVRVDAHADPYKEPVPGQMFPGQNWWVGSPSAITREQPSTLAIVGAETLYDLRSGTAVGPSPLELD